MSEVLDRLFVVAEERCINIDSLKFRKFYVDENSAFQIKSTNKHFNLPSNRKLYSYEITINFDLSFFFLSNHQVSNNALKDFKKLQFNLENPIHIFEAPEFIGLYFFFIFHAESIDSFQCRYSILNPRKMLLPTANQIKPPIAVDIEKLESEFNKWITQVNYAIESKNKSYFDSFFKEGNKKNSEHSPIGDELYATLETKIDILQKVIIEEFEENELKMDELQEQISYLKSEIKGKPIRTIKNLIIGDIFSKTSSIVINQKDYNKYAKYFFDLINDTIFLSS